MTPYRYRRLGRLRPPRYSVDTPWDCLGEVEAVEAGRPGQSRSTNRYLAYPLGSRGFAVDVPLGGRQEPTVYRTRRAAADALLEYETSHAADLRVRRAARSGR